MIYTKLKKHQKQIVEFAKDKNFVGIFSKYGSGKTLTSLMMIEQAQYKAVLVVSTKTSVQGTWPQQIRIHSNFKYFILLGTAQQKISLLTRGLNIVNTQSGRYHRSVHIPVLFLINFDGVKNIGERLKYSNFDAIFVDESTKIKSSSTARTKYLWALGKDIPRRVILTGFPVTEKLQDIYSQAKFLDGGKALGNSEYGFLNNYFVKMGPKLIPTRNAAKQVWKQLSPFCVHINDKDIDLPKTMFNKITVEMTSQQKEILESLNKSFQLEYRSVNLDIEFIFALIKKSLQICDGFVTDKEKNLELIPTNKDEALLDIIEDINVQKNKVIIWASFLFSIAKIHRILKQFKIPAITLTGKTDNVAIVEKKFRQSKMVNVLIATPRKAAESLNFPECGYAIYYGNDWSYDARANSEGRIRRMDSPKHRTVVYTDLVTKGADVEQAVYACLRQKANLVQELKLIFQGGKT